MVDNSRSCRSCMNNGGSSNNKAMLKKLQMIDFAIVETVLYLDAYPNSSAALSYYHKLVSERNKLVDSLAKNGMPITNMDNSDTDNWLWTKGPWPWQSEAN
ncbi:MAG: spore coat protein CotJB [Clostridia bacterium]|nr:spore coat protein CotJB [Clostridia bacterium]